MVWALVIKAENDQQDSHYRWIYIAASNIANALITTTVHLFVTRSDQRKNFRKVARKTFERNELLLCWR
jgi:hypothetical protein